MKSKTKCVSSIRHVRSDNCVVDHSTEKSAPSIRDSSTSTSVTLDKEEPKCIDQ